MGKASRAKRDRRTGRPARREPASPEAILPGSGEHSVASCYSMGMYTYGKYLVSGQMPVWLHRADPLDLLYIGAACEPGYVPDDGEATLANGRDGWLDRLRPTTSWEGVEDLVRRAAGFAAEQGQPVDTSGFHLAFARYLAADPAMACRRPLPAELRPRSTDSRALSDLDTLLGAAPAGPAADTGELVDLLRLARVDLNVPWDETPHDALRLGLRRLSHWSMPGHIIPAMALFAGAHGFDDHDAADFAAFGARAGAWIGGIPLGTPLGEIADLIGAGVAERRTAADILREILALPQATVPSPAEDWAWRSSTGLATVREATALGLSVLTRAGQVIAMDSVQAAIMAAFQDENEAAARSRQRTDAFGRPLPDDGWLTHAQRMTERATIAPPLFSAATAHATETTGLMPPLPGGFPDPRQQQRWDQATASYLAAHPGTDHDPRLDARSRAQQMLAFESYVAHRHPRVGHAVVTELRTDPAHWRVDLLATGFPCDAGPELVEPAARAHLDELARAFDVDSTGVDQALALVNAHPAGFTDPDAQRAARTLAPALFCALTVVLHGD
ncbi:hypothetical protein [Streptacidiphilus jiangxiensis]|uniref:Uncharacterized protein n=1 Tax=Streptacidiphilus jiangxiensis TaxID=235985 RepID=A0A1H8BAW1_STRJI|nr:hypothetical protein [Streptacidiphilus jiangxiensis]SEM78977.1 hypothetical protein SAMN05414137_1596 [Streptacidiphilus jiangxiensis]